MINPKIREEIQKLSQKYELKLFIIFGSRAKNTQNKLSDWDFAFYPPKNWNIDKEITLFEEIQNIIKTNNIDLINCKTAKSLLLLNNIFTKGNCLYENQKNLFDKMQMDIWMDYQDFKKYYEEEKDLTNKRLEAL